MINDRMPLRVEIAAAEAIRKRQEVAYSAAMLLSMSGRGAFWRIDCKPLEAWEGEQEFAIAAAVREALADEAMTPEQAWEHVKARVRLEAGKYAEWRAEESQ